MSTNNPTIGPAPRTAQMTEVDVEPEAAPRKTAAAKVEPSFAPPSTITPLIPEPFAIQPASVTGVRPGHNSGIRTVVPADSPGARLSQKIPIEVPKNIAHDPAAVTRYLFEQRGEAIQAEIIKLERPGRTPLTAAHRLELVLAWAAQAAHDGKTEGDEVTRYDTRSALHALLVIAHQGKDVGISGKARDFAMDVSQRLEEELVRGGMSRDEAQRQVAELITFSGNGWHETHRQAARSSWYREAARSTHGEPQAAFVFSEPVPNDVLVTRDAGSERHAASREHVAAVERDAVLRDRNAAQHRRVNLAKRDVIRDEIARKAAEGNPAEKV